MYSMPTSSKKKYRMDDKLRSETKVSEKNTKIQKKIEKIKEEIYQVFKKNEADYYVKIRSVNIIRGELRDDNNKEVE